MSVPAFGSFYLKTFSRRFACGSEKRSNKMKNYSVEKIKTISYKNQKPGTSGLRKSVKTFQQPHYLENYIQSIFLTLGKSVEGSLLVVGGDGRFYMKEALATIIKIAAANKVSKLLVGQNGILSTPAVSCIIRKYSASGGILLTASHNPGGPDKDFGIKLNLSNGGSAPDLVTAQLFNISKQIEEYLIVPDITVDINTLGINKFQVEGKDFIIEVIDSVSDYMSLMKSLFDFDRIRSLIKGTETRRPFKILLNSMNGVTGPYVERIFIEELGLDRGNVMNIKPLPDFGGIHPDPNLTYSADMVNRLRNGDEDFGAAFDGDGDRNMILGEKAFFVNPSDSLAVLADHLTIVPHFQKTRIKGFARSMPTSTAVDRVAHEKNVKVYEVPTGWKYFGSLMDAQLISLCGEESFGTGSDHLREKDGIWTVLAWLTIIEKLGLPLHKILENHWYKFGRSYFLRYDYDCCDSEKCNEMIKYLEELITSPNYPGTVYHEKGKTYKVKYSDNFAYSDPVLGSRVTNQGLRIFFEDGSRIIVRLSGTGSNGSTVRLYMESYEKDPSQISFDPTPEKVMEPLISIALQISRMNEFTGREKPSIIT